MYLGVNMAHYAFLDENNLVTEVIVGKNEGEDNIDARSGRQDCAVEIQEYFGVEQ